MEPGEAAAPAAPDATSDSALARIPGVFFSPVKTFESIARRPTWIAALILMTAMSLGLTAAVLQKLDYDQVIRQPMQKRGQTIPAARMSSIIERQEKFGGRL